MRQYKMLYLFLLLNIMLSCLGFLVNDNQTCVDDPDSILALAPEIINNCSKVIKLVNGNCGTDITPFVTSDFFTPPTNPYTVSQLCCESCQDLNPGLFNPNVTGCDYFYCTEVCYQYAYCATQPDANCINAPMDCGDRCSGCDPCMDDPAGFLSQVGGCDSIIDFLGGENMYCNTDISRWDLTGLMPVGIYFGWMACPSRCGACPGGNFTFNQCVDDASGVLDLFGGCESTSNLLGGSTVFCNLDVSPFDGVSTVPSGTTGAMICPKMCHGCNPANSNDTYVTPWDYDNITICYQVNCTVLNMTGTYNPETHAFMLSQLTALRKVTLTQNNLTSLGSVFQGHVDILDMNLRHNSLSYFPKSELSSQHKLLELDLSYNLIHDIPTGILTELSALRVLYLGHNMISHIGSYAFSHNAIDLHGTLTMLNIANQNLDTKGYIALDEYAFAACCEDDPENRPHHSPLVMSMNRIPEIPAYSFVGLNRIYVDLNHVGVEIVNPNAFTGASNLSVDLRGNNIREMSYLSFGSSLDSSKENCTDFLRFTVSFSVLPDYVNSYTCEEALAVTTELENYLYTLRGPDQATVFDACCLYGGGHAYGLALMTDSYSDVTCRSIGGIAHCGCGCVDCRYDVTKRTCFSSCRVGQKWSFATSIDEFGLLNPSESGRCLDCVPGRYLSSNIDFPTECIDCSAGRFTDKFMSTSCNKCEKNYYSEPGATVCTSCSYGRWAGTDSGDCSVCSALYLGSENCDVPILGMILLSLLLMSLFCFARYLRRWYLKQEEVKSRLRIEVAKHRSLLKAKCTDLALMGTGWKIAEKQVRLDEQIARSKDCEVWRGAFNDRWVVAVKMLLTGQRGMLKRETQFMMRTRHERLVMFLGRGHFKDGREFLVSEWMSGGSLDKLLWPNQEQLSWLERMQILLDICEGVAFLHLIHKSLHRDLKSPNVLLTLASESGGTRRAKIADFGTSRRVRTKKQVMTPRHRPLKKNCQSHRRKFSDEVESHKSVKAAGWVRHLGGYIGTAEWMAPEVMQETAVYGPSADIYSFAVVMWEMWSRQKPWREYTGDTNPIFELVRGGNRLNISNINSEAPQGYVDLMTRCWNQDPKDRPLIDSIQTHISRMMNARAEELRSRFVRKKKPRVSSNSSSETTWTHDLSHKISAGIYSEGSTTQGLGTPVHRTRSAENVYSYHSPLSGMKSRRFSATPILRSGKLSGLSSFKSSDSDSSLVSIDLGPPAISKKCSGIELTEINDSSSKSELEYEEEEGNIF